ncbi:serine hydrolase domain-containing protein [Veronia pacifica]|uniref:6-aminohexanoate hydrolase n=1 Tax=Veronia pacifica TaxID=1080227 RepID=A0A1C3EPQ9_9GAMM|nr:serine hydrolase [Veronia pacifica]ODA35238.1 6-aminohexanoate hydrolase [Veronia pacifica]
MSLYRLSPFISFLLFLILIMMSFTTHAGYGKYPDAEQSDPRTLGWMQGTPPPADKRIMQPQSNYFSFPKLRWTLCHIRELMPTQLVSRGISAPLPIDYDLDPAINRITFSPTGSSTLMTWADSLSENYTDGILVMHKGKVVYEEYFGCLTQFGKHTAMSMTKSLTGLLAEILIAEGKLDPKAKIATLVPELKDSAFGSATVRQVMDMTTSLAYSENYADPNADIWAYTSAADPLPKAKDYNGPVGYFEYLKTVKQEGKHGEAFGYKTVNTDALGWVISRVTGKKVSDYLSDRIWRRIGAEQNAYMTVDAVGIPFAGGGLTAGLRDLGRIGQLMLDEGQHNGQQIFPESVVTSIQAGGDKTAFAKSGYKDLKGGSYKSMWWIFHNNHGAYAARGVHGQTIYIDPVAEMVIVRFASFPVASNSHIDPTSLPAYQAVADYLLSK